MMIFDEAAAPGTVIKVSNIKVSNINDLTIISFDLHVSVFGVFYSCCLWVTELIHIYFFMLGNALIVK